MPAIEYFASQNTSEGFLSRFSSVFCEERLRKLYIVKGGPGTGKSHLMKQIAAAWEKDGAVVERFLCSSDPDSLDAVLHLQQGIAVIDGTPPHTMEGRYPGCISTILNTGAFWDTKRLEEQRPVILELCKQKERAYASAYAYLRATGQTAAARKHLAMQDPNEEKLLAAARRFLKKELSGREERVHSIRLTKSYGKKGLLSLRTLENLSLRRCLVCDCHGTGNAFLSALLRESELNCICSYSPLFPNEPDGLYFPQKRLCVVCEKKETWEKEFTQADRYINMERFLNAEKLRSHRQKLRFAAKCQAALEQGATDAFEKAAAFHRQLEEIYSSAMDFTAFSQYEREIVSSLR